MHRAKITLIVSLFFMFVALAACRAQEPQRLVLATTTSTYDTGLLDAILPAFEDTYNADVSVIAVGTGQALELGRAGDADVLLVHARQQEDEFVAVGYGTERRDVMYNDFVILGPRSDPAGIGRMQDVVAALQQVAAREAPFVSRGDDSGTHLRELALWAEAGIMPEGQWYQSVGQGMGATLTIADEQQAYTLSDRGTYLARVAEGIDLQILIEGDSRLSNPYGVIPVNPERHPEINAALASEFVDWLTSGETQAAIADFQVAGQQLFFPNADGACPPACSGASNE